MPKLRTLKTRLLRNLWECGIGVTYCSVMRSVALGELPPALQGSLCDNRRVYLPVDGLNCGAKHLHINSTHNLLWSIVDTLLGLRYSETGATEYPVL